MKLVITALIVIILMGNPKFHALAADNDASTAVLVNDEPITAEDVLNRQHLLASDQVLLTASAIPDSMVLSRPEIKPKIQAILQGIIGENPGLGKQAISDKLQNAIRVHTPRWRMEMALAKSLQAVRQKAIDDLIEDKLREAFAKTANVSVNEADVDAGDPSVAGKLPRVETRLGEFSSDAVERARKSLNKAIAVRAAWRKAARTSIYGQAAPSDKAAEDEFEILLKKKLKDMRADSIIEYR